jgi:hypothetical protein
MPEIEDIMMFSKNKEIEIPVIPAIKKTIQNFFVK